MVTFIVDEHTKLMNSSLADDTYISDDGAEERESGDAVSLMDDEYRNGDASEVVNHASSSMIPPDTIPTVVVSILLGLVSGTLYGFGRYARALKEVLILSQSQVQNFGICLDCGNYIGHPITGMIYDRYGPTISCLLAACIVSGSYVTLHLILVQNQQDDEATEASISVFSIVMLSTAFAGVGFGSGLGYIAGLGSTTKLFLSHPQYLSRAISLVAAGFGLSSTFVGLSYHWLGLGFFFLFWAIVSPIVNLGAAYMFRKEAIVELDDIALSNQEPSGLEEVLLVEPSTEEENEESKNDECRSIEDAPIVEHLQALHSNSDGLWESWKHIDYWLLFFSFACVTGCGLFVINNLSTMVQSSGESDSFASSLVISLSLANVLGRIVMGSLGDATHDVPAEGRKKRRLRLLQMTHLIMTVAFITVILSGQQKACLIIMVVMVALAYGGSWVAVVSILSDLFGKEHFGKDYGLLAMGPALSGMALNNLSARLYDQHTSSDSNNVCVGSHCYRTAYFLAGIIALLGLASMELLIRKRRQAVV
jgi:MFS family permease